MYTRAKSLEKAQNFLLALSDKKPEAKEIVAKLDTLHAMEEKEVEAFHSYLMTFLPAEKKEDSDDVNVLFGNAIYQTLLAVSCAHPINTTSLMLMEMDETSPERIVTSDRYQFYKNEIVPALKSHEAKHNPYTRKPFNDFDLAAIKKYCDSDLSFTGLPEIGPGFEPDEDDVDEQSSDVSDYETSGDEYEDAPVVDSTFVISSLLVHHNDAENKNNDGAALLNRCKNDPAEAKTILLDDDLRNLVLDDPEFNAERLYDIAISNIDTAKLILQNETLASLFFPNNGENNHVFLSELFEVYPDLASDIFVNEKLTTIMTSSGLDTASLLDLAIDSSAKTALDILQNPLLAKMYLLPLYSDINAERLDGIAHKYAENNELVELCHQLKGSLNSEVGEFKPVFP